MRRGGPLTHVLGHPGRALDALREVVSARERTDFVTLVLRGCDARAMLALHAVPHILRASADYDERRAAFDALAAETLLIDGRPMAQVSALDPRALRTLRDAARCADRVAVASWTQWERLPHELDIRSEKVEIAATISELPTSVTGVRDAVVVYATDEYASLVAFIVFALQELHAPILVVGDLSLCGAMRAEACDAGRALGRARVLIAPALDDPEIARALAAHDAALVVPFTSGIDSYLSGAIRYEPWDRLSVLAAVQEALGAPAPRALPPNEAIAAFPLVATAGELVSIAIRTFNRRNLFARALASVASQTYLDIEILCVNDGDEDVADIVARYPQARLVGNETRLGAIPSLNVALRAAQGRWFGWLDDDDRYFPDHIARLVDALQRSGLRGAHADTLSEFFERTPSGSYARYGLAVNLDGDIDRDTIHIADGVGPMAALIDRAWLLESGGFDEALGHAEDWELWIRLARTDDFAHVRAVTAAYSIRNDASNMMAYGGEAMLRAMRRIVSLDPLRDRPMLAAARRELVATMEANAGRASFPEPPYRFTE